MFNAPTRPDAAWRRVATAASRRFGMAPAGRGISMAARPPSGGPGAAMRASSSLLIAVGCKTCRRWARLVAAPSLPEPHSRLFGIIQPASSPAFVESVLFRRRKNPPRAEAVSPPPPPRFHSRSLTREKLVYSSVAIRSAVTKRSSIVGQEKSAESGFGFPAEPASASFEEPDERKAWLIFGFAAARLYGVASSGSET